MNNESYGGGGSTDRTEIFELSRAIEKLKDEIRQLREIQEQGLMMKWLEEHDNDTDLPDEFDISRN